MPVCKHNPRKFLSVPSIAFFKKHPMGFKLKIVLVVFCILAISQIMGSIFSVLSFEEVYLAAMTSKYEILGKDLKRRIEHSLKFGKRLDRFIGIEKVMDPILGQASDIDEIFLSDGKGRLWYSSKDSPHLNREIQLPPDQTGRGSASEQPPGKRAPSGLYFDGKRYSLLFSITAPYGDERGVLGLAFSRAALDRKKEALLQNAIQHLALSVFMTATALFLMIEFFFSRPLTRWIGIQIKSNGPDGAATPKTVSAPFEFRILQTQMEAYYEQIQAAHDESQEVIGLLEAASDQPQHVRKAVAGMKKILEGKNNDAD